METIIPTERPIFRVERRAADTEAAKQHFGLKFLKEREWKLVVNSDENFRYILNRYKDNELMEYRIRRFNDEKKFSS